MNRFRDGFRTEGAAFLIWYLVNFFRIGEDEAKDSVCDAVGDKGIDGIWIDQTEDEEEIYIFQSKFSPLDDSNQGDTDLRDFVGSRSWFSSVDGVKQLLSSTANQELKALIQRLNIEEMVSRGCDISAIFITNKTFDLNAKEYLEANKDKIEGYDAQSIRGKYTYVAEEEEVHAQTTLSLENPTRIEYDLEGGGKVNVLAIRAKELLRLSGIGDNSLFSRNVRYGLGRTRVNKDIKNTIAKGSEHAKFFLYHNGITITCRKLDLNADSVKLTDYSVVNGCQSMLTFYENGDKLSDKVFVLTKIIELPLDATVSVQDITVWTNNQNSISVRDLKANDVIQRSLKREFDEFFEGRVLYRRQKGDSTAGYQEVIERDFAAQLIAALYLRQPNITYVRDRLFTDKYYDVFSIHVNAAKIYLANVIYKTIDKNVDRLHFTPIQNYGLARFFMLYVVGELLRGDPDGEAILADPRDYVEGAKLAVLEGAVERLFRLLVFDIDNFIVDWQKEHDNFFDYKNFFKNGDLVVKMSQWITTAYNKQLVHHPEDAFGRVFESLAQEHAGDSKA